MLKNLPTMQETHVWSLGQEDPLEKEMATHCSPLAWKIPWATIHGVAKSWTWLSDFTFTFFISECPIGFPYIVQFMHNFAIRSSWSEPQSAPRLVFADYAVSASLAAKSIINLISVFTIWWCQCVESSRVSLEEDVCYDQCVPLAKLSAFALLHLVH